jgi:hypothetical protein
VKAKNKGIPGYLDARAFGYSPVGTAVVSRVPIEDISSEATCTAFTIF